MENAINQVVNADQARINLTFNGLNADLLDPVNRDLTDMQVRTLVSEALRAGNIPGMEPNSNEDFSDFIIDRFSPTETRPWSLLVVRPKTPFGN
jgi:hypothetical protein